MKGLKRGRSGAVATLELVIVGALLLLAVGIAAPMISDQITATDRARAIGDLRQLAVDMLNYRKDTGVWPGGGAIAFTDGRGAVGEEGCLGGGSGCGHISRFLLENGAGVAEWKGPYMSMSRPDPWGNRYVVVLDGLRQGTGYGWVLCAGPDGVFETTREDQAPRGDDLGLLLR